MICVRSLSLLVVSLSCLHIPIIINPYLSIYVIRLANGSLIMESYELSRCSLSCIDGFATYLQLFRHICARCAGYGMVYRYATHYNIINSG